MLSVINCVARITENLLGLEVHPKAMSKNLTDKLDLSFVNV